MRMNTLGTVPATSLSIIRVLSICMLICLPAALHASPASVEFSNPPGSIEAYDFAEVAASVHTPDAPNPFVDASFSGTLKTKDGSKTWNIEGFCDSPDGSVYRIRFMAAQPGDYTYTVTYRQGAFQKTATGTFKATNAHRRGILAVDPQYPWHFLWTGTGEHFFFNGTTAYWLVGWRDDHVIEYNPRPSSSAQGKPSARDDRGPRGDHVLRRTGDDRAKLDAADRRMAGPESKRSAAPRLRL